MRAMRDGQPGRLAGLLRRIAEALVADWRREDELERRIAERTADLKAREEALLGLYARSNEQNAMKEKLFAVLAHDLRGPVGTVRNLLAAIVENGEAFTERELRSYLPEMHRSVASVYELLENLLDWVRSQMDEIRALQERLEISSLVEGLVSSLSEAAEAKGLRLEIETAAGLCAYSDRRMVEAILRNFLTNAIKFTPRGGAIRVITLRSDDASSTLVRVEDTGMGMDEATLKALFTMDPAKRRDGSSGERGSGIGLVFCADLARRLGGRIEAESVVGGGSVFTLFIPDVFECDLPVEEERGPLTYRRRLRRTRPWRAGRGRRPRIRRRAPGRSAAPRGRYPSTCCPGIPRR
jgi:signal transduction histidine kinase